MRVHANGIAIEVDDQGPPNGEPLLMIMGLGMQLVAWPQPLVDTLVRRGFRVIRFDNRDIGLSQHFDEAGLPNLPYAGLRYALRLPLPPAYRLADMAADALGVLDALRIPRAHVCGASMGGMIAQHLAAAHPQRLRSLTLMMTTSGSRRLPQPSARVQRALMARPASRELDALLDHGEALFRLIGSPAYPAPREELRARLASSIRRSFHPAGSARQLVAIAADGDRSALLKRIQAPTLVIHGEADPLVPVAAGHELAERIAGAEKDIVPGMGHDFPAELLPRFAAGIVSTAQRAAAG